MTRFKTSRSAACAALLVLFLFSSTGSAEVRPNVVGKWSAEFESQIGHQKYVYEFRVEGEKLTGTAHREVEGDVRDTPLTEGKVKGDEISFVEVLKLDDRELRIEYTGKLAEADEIKLTRKVEDLATNQIVAKRVKDSATQPATRPRGT